MSMRSRPRSNLEAQIRLALGICLVLLLAVLLLRLLLPWLLMGGLLAGAYIFWQRYQQQQRSHSAFLNNHFYQLLRQQQGQISVLDFAMLTQLSGPEAKQYLDAQAKAFHASFEASPRGDVLYIFNLGCVQPPPAVDIQPAEIQPNDIRPSA
ncbi:MAG: hypothetical protein F6J97_18615 [Leptolyngbya sp. SIO4C1]|nr:hypothetical protein [Leptolyngbya sp. SIO4C1]